VLLARLALDHSLQAQGLGGALLAEALERVLAATETVAARFVVVDAINEDAARFYEHHGFTQIPGTLRLVQKASDIAAAIR
jgi:GNAT superfamily N-acetyltransferase